jgi:alkylation response protein AidB-like acyl-CoA dehydrogenase
VALNCVRIHGGSGWVSDFPAERYYREAPYFVLVEGSNEIQKTIIARRLLAGDGQSVGL